MSVAPIQATELTSPRTVAYEQPLNERMRTFMRLEFLFEQLAQNAPLLLRQPVAAQQRAELRHQGIACAQQQVREVAVAQVGGHGACAVGEFTHIIVGSSVSTSTCPARHTRRLR